MKRSRVRWFGALLIGSLAAPLGAAPPQNLDELAIHFARLGLEPLPGESSFLVAGGVAGVFNGSPAEGEEKPFVLVTAGPPAGPGQMALFSAFGKHGLQAPVRLPPAFTNLGRHVIVAYLEGPPGPNDRSFLTEGIAAHLDLARLDQPYGSRLLIRASGSSTIWPRLIEQTNIPLGAYLEIEEAPDLGSPLAAAAYGQGIPGLLFETLPPVSATAPAEVGVLPTVLFPALLAAKVSRLDEPPVFQRVERNADDPKPASSRPSTGTIPDYTADVEGLRLEGVVESGPAEEAGLQEGDVIVELAGSTIEDVYGYAEVLDTLEINVPIQVVFLRDGERRETTLTPQGRSR